MGTIEYVIAAVVTVLVVALAALAVRGQAAPTRAATTSLADVWRSLARQDRNATPVIGTILMVGITIVLSAVIYLMVTGLVRS